MKATPTLTDVLSESELLLIAEALFRLRETKQQALQAVREAGMQPGGRPFEERDFGMPEIDRLLARLDAAELADDIAARELGQGHDAYVLDDGIEA